MCVCAQVPQSIVNDSLCSSDVVLELQKRLGRFVELPGILVDGTTWISETEGRSWKDGLDKYCLNKLLTTTASSSSSSSSSSIIRDDDIFFRPFDPHQDQLGHRQVSLPNGTKKSIIDLTDELVQYHQYDDGIFKGERALGIYKRHYGARNDSQAIRFGYRLIGLGILNIVESSPAGFGDSEVQLFATLPGRNTMIAWPGRKMTQLGDVLRLLHGIRRTIEKVSQPGDPQRRLQLMQQLDLEVCALQACTLHKSSTLFLLQLFNVMILHYGLSHALPTTLPDILKLHEIIGYRIDDTYVTAADLRTWLLQGASGSKPPRVISDEKRKSKMSLLLCSKVTEDDYQEAVQAQHAFSTCFITTDKRLIFAMVWTNGMGTQEAPLDQIVASYCQSHIAIYNNTVFLPPLLRWFRRDFGKKPLAILRSLQQYLPIDHRLQIQTLQEKKSLRVAFRHHHVTRLSQPVDLDDDEGTSQDLGSLEMSCYLEGATVSDNNTMIGAMSILGGMSRISMGQQSSRFNRIGGSGYRAQSTHSIAKGARDTIEQIQPTESSSSDEDATRSTTEGSSTAGGGGHDYANWFQSEMSVMSYGSDFDVLVNEAYFNGGEADKSQRSISLLK